MLNFFGVGATLVDVDFASVETRATGYEGGAHWQVYSELKARVKALKLRAEHCCMAVLTGSGRCRAVYHHNIINDYMFDCTGNPRATDAERAEKMNKERNLH